MEITDLNRTYLETGNLRVKNLGRRTAWLDTGNPRNQNLGRSGGSTFNERAQVAFSSAFQRGCADGLRVRALGKLPPVKKLNIFRRKKVETGTDHSQSPYNAVSSRLVNLGCGAHYHPEWDNYDFAPTSPSVRPIDLSQPLPFSEASYEMCYMSHVLEHLPRQRAPKLLSEIFKILKPGGALRIVVPDLEAIVRLYLKELDAAASGDQEASYRHEWMTLELIDQMTRSFSGGFLGRTLLSRPLPHREFIEKRLGWESRHWLESVDSLLETGSEVLPSSNVYHVPDTDKGQEALFRQSGEVHRWMYDRLSLQSMLSGCGYINTTVCRADVSRIPNFSRYCLDTLENGEVRKPDSLFMEASKPN